MSTVTQPLLTQRLRISQYQQSGSESRDLQTETSGTTDSLFTPGIKTASTVAMALPEGTVFKSVAAGDPLLDLIYEQLIFPFFPSNDCDERRAIDIYLANNKVNRKKRIQYHVVAALKNRALIGATIFSFIGCENVCFMNGQYTAVMPEERRKHLAKMLSNYRVEIAQLEARRFGYPALDLSIITLASSQNRSVAFPNPASPDLATLQKIWRDFGHGRIHFPFVQLPLAESKASSPALLGIKRHSDRYLHRDYLTKEEMKCIVDG